LADKQGRFESGLKDAPVTVFAQDLQMRYTWIYNPFAGLSETDILGKTDADLLSGTEAEVIAGIKKEALSHGEAR